MRLGRKFRFGLKWSAVSAVFTSGLQFVQLLVLTRFLEKSDFGKFAAAYLFFSICLEIQSTAINNTILHRMERSQFQLSALFWYNILLGLILGGFLFGMGGIIAVWYEDLDTQEIIKHLALVMPLLGAAGIMKSLWQMNMDYKHIGFIEIFASICSFLFTIFLAVMGYGWKALMWGIIIKLGLESILFLFWKPLLRPSLTLYLDNKDVYLRLGKAQIFERITTLLTFQIDTLIIGRLLGMEALGVYDVLKRILLRPSNILSQIVERVALPLYARLQKRKLILKKTYYGLLKKIVTVHFFVYGTIALIGFFLLPKLLGENWNEYVFEFQLFTGVVLIHSMLNPVDSFLVAIGKIERWFWANAILLPALFFSTWLGSYFNLEGVIIAQLITLVLFLLLVYQIVLEKEYRLTYGESVDLFWQSIKTFIPMLILTLLLVNLIKNDSWWWIVVPVFGFIIFLQFSGIKNWNK